MYFKNKIISYLEAQDFSCTFSWLTEGRKNPICLYSTQTSFGTRSEAVAILSQLVQQSLLSQITVSTSNMVVHTSLKKGYKSFSLNDKKNSKPSRKQDVNIKAINQR